MSEARLWWILRVKLQRPRQRLMKLRQLMLNHRWVTADIDEFRGDAPDISQNGTNLESVSEKKLPNVWNHLEQHIFYAKFMFKSDLLNYCRSRKFFNKNVSYILVGYFFVRRTSISCYHLKTDMLRWCSQLTHSSTFVELHFAYPMLPIAALWHHPQTTFERKWLK